MDDSTTELGEASVLFQVIHAHPLTDSYNHALFRAIVETLERGGHEVIATDLYRENFAPLLTADERRSYHAPVYDSSAVTRYAEILRRVDGVIFCFPQWWFGMPAVLKGYVDRIWVPGIAFEHDLARGRLKPLLTGIKIFGVVTSYGSPWWISRIVAGDPGRKMLMRALKPMCGGASSFYLAHYAMDKSTAETRAAFLAKVRRRIERL
jgi:NAD(P)H dehydrogenase (quinone)